MQTQLVSVQSSIVLPTDWSMSTDSNGCLNICKIAQVPSSSTSNQPLSLSHCLTINRDLTWKLYVCGKRVDVSTCKALQSVSTTLRPASANTLLETLDSLNVCIGNPDEHFVELCIAHKGHILSPDGSVIAFKDVYCTVMFEGDSFDSTVRTSKCDLLVNGLKCENCKKYRSVLRAMYSRQCKSNSSSERCEISSHVNYRYLSTPEINTRMTNLRAEVIQQKRKIDALKKGLLKLMAWKLMIKCRMTCSIMDEMTGKVEEQFPEHSFVERIFWNQQLEARKVTDRRQLRWHPALIKWCLSLKLVSSSAYHALRSSGILILPSERTLRDYTHWMKSDAGFSDSVDKDLMKEAKIDTVWDFQKHACLVFDEVRIKEDLVYDKHSCQIIGFVNLGEVNNQLLELERSEKGKPEQCIAKHIVVFMVRNLFSKLEFPYVQFPCSALSADLIFPLVWDCVKRLESLGFYVMALTADGASCNRKFFRMHSSKETLTYKTKNVFSRNGRPIFFISDVPHLIKTVRNCWANSFGHNRTRELKV